MAVVGVAEETGVTESIGVAVGVSVAVGLIGIAVGVRVALLLIVAVVVDVRVTLIVVVGVTDSVAVATSVPVGSVAIAAVGVTGASVADALGVIVDGGEATIVGDVVGNVAVAVSATVAEDVGDSVGWAVMLVGKVVGVPDTGGDAVADMDPIPRGTTIPVTRREDRRRWIAARRLMEVPFLSMRGLAMWSSLYSQGYGFRVSQGKTRLGYWEIAK